MGMFTVNVDKNSTHPPTLSFFDVIDEVKLPRFLEQDLFGTDVGKNVTLAAIKFLQPFDVVVHICPFERLASGHAKSHFQGIITE